MSVSEDENVWVIEPTTRKLEFDSVRFISPSGFKWVLYREELVPFLARLAAPSVATIMTSDTSRVRKDGEDLVVMDADPWENKDFMFNAYICSIEELAFAIAGYVRSQWPKS
jgi:hypothetical protein